MPHAVDDNSISIPTLSSTQDFSSHISNLVRQHSKVTIVHSKGSRKRGLLSQVLKNRSTNVSLLEVNVTHPTWADVEETFSALSYLAKSGTHALIAIGGGSVLDLAKGLRRKLLLPSSNLERPLISVDAETITEFLSNPFILIPTTAGSGSEATSFATFWNFEECRKISIEGPDLVGRPVLLRNVTGTQDWNQALCSGIDATSHALESLWNVNRSARSIELSKHALQECLSALTEMKADKSDPGPRNRMMIASHLAGRAIAETRTALVHALSYPVTLNLGVPHGKACGYLLPLMAERAARSENDSELSVLYKETFDKLRVILQDQSLLGAAGNRLITHPELVLQVVSNGRAENYSFQIDTDEILGIVSKSAKLDSNAWT